MQTPLIDRLPTRRGAILTGFLCVSLTWAACEEGGSPSGPGDSPADPSAPAAILLSTGILSFESLGMIQTVDATVSDQYGADMPSVVVAWTSSDPQVVTVSSTGVVTAIGNGAATLTVSAGTVSAEVEVTVAQVIVSIRITDSAVMETLGDPPRSLEVLGFDANGFEEPMGPVAWVSSDPAIAAVDAAGTLTSASLGWTLVTVTAAALSDTVVAHVRTPGLPGPLPAMRALHLGGNWLGNELHEGVPHPEFWSFIDSLDVNWVGVSVALHYGVSTDPTISRVYDGQVTRTFSDEVLRTLIQEFRARGIDVYVTLAFEPEEGAGVPGRWLIGQPWLEGGFTAAEWPWLPTHPNHDQFVADFWSSYTAHAVHFARIAGEEGAALFSVGTESDRLFRTRPDGLWVTDFGDEIRNMVTEVRNVFPGMITYDQLYNTTLETGFYGTAPGFIWEDAGFDAIGLSAWYRLLDLEPTSVVPVDALQSAWEDVLGGVILSMQQDNPTRPIFFTEVGFVDDIRAPGNPTIEEFDPKAFSDANGNGLDDGEEAQANILEAFYRALQTYPIVEGTFWWDHAMDADAEIEHESQFRSTRVRGKLAEEILRLVYRGSN